MEWKMLLCETRQSRTGVKRSESDARNEFQKDYHRIVGSASFRRLQDKTQVFPLDKSDFIRTRLTHSMEVSSFAKSLGQSVCQYIMSNGLDRDVDAETKEKICSILECAGLIHDIGNPPFGHFGEEAIRSWFRTHLRELSLGEVGADKLLNEQMQKDLYQFEGNAQALRLLTKLHYLVDENGMHLTYGLLNTLVKYPVSSCGTDKASGNVKDKKIGYYYAEQKLYETISAATGTVGCRHPLTWLLEAADDIAYTTADIEDSVKKGHITYRRLLQELRSEKYKKNCADAMELEKYNEVVGWLEEKYDKAKKRETVNPEMNAVQNWIISVQGFLIKRASYVFTRNYAEIMAGTFKQELLKASFGNVLVKALGDIAYRYVFRSREILKLEVAAGTILDFLLDRFVRAAVTFETGKPMTPMADRLMSLISDNYKQTYRKSAEGKGEGEKLYLRLLLVTDFVCGMTDSYAKNLYQELSGII